MEDILLSPKQYQALVQRLDGINSDLASIKYKTSPEMAFIDTFNLAKLLGVTSRTIQRWRKDGRLPYQRLGTKVFYNVDAIMGSFKVFPISVMNDLPQPVEITTPDVVKEEEITCKRCPLFLLLIM